MAMRVAAYKESPSTKEVNIRRKSWKRKQKKINYMHHVKSKASL